ncbi:histidine kinase [Cereibacter sphaeroides]|uniref:sensor histidine kinase n=1 Tax=Cereibacter sphaeroides TaxID=1063 RepID=UPI001F27B175|nr:histidine kinase [Cereibacter sphaeroides]MCE6949698.1 histidine kinase [Cereibacter sphaeroides]
MTFARPLARRWQHSSLAARFGLAGGVVLAVASLLVGLFVTSRIEDSVVRNTATATALYMESFISPISQQLAGSEQLSDNARRALEEIFTNTPLGQRVVSYKIWKPGGRVVEASDKTLIGRSFPASEGLRGAWAGKISAEFERLGDVEDRAEAAMGLPLLEIYSPIREVWSGDIIAVAEFYEINRQLADDLASARRSAWLTVGLVGTSLGAALYLIVLGGSRTIEAQRRDLDARLEELRGLSSHNRDLRLRIEEAAARATATAEHALRRIGADLHDGPAQYLAFAALRLDDLRDAQADEVARRELESVRDALAMAMAEVRGISRGLTLPDIADKPPDEVARMAIAAHRDRTGEAVAEQLESVPTAGITPATRICIYRFVQEGLNNASRHAGGAGLRVSLTGHDDSIELRVADGGSGFGEGGPGFGLGLTGLRDRIESLGGRFEAGPSATGGAEIGMTLRTGGER